MSNQRMKELSPIISIVDNILPMVIPMIPAEIRNEQMCTLINKFLTYDDEQMSKFLACIEYDEPQLEGSFSTTIKAIRNLCEFLSNNSSDDVSIRQLTTVLALPSKVIVDKNIKISVAGVNMTKTITNCLNHGVSHETIDIILSKTGLFISKVLTQQLVNVKFSTILSLFD